MGLYSVHTTRGSDKKRLRADIHFIIQTSFYTKKFNNVIKSYPYTNMTLLLYCCQKECTQLLIKGIYPNNHDENNNTAQQFWKREVALNLFYPYLNWPLHTHTHTVVNRYAELSLMGLQGDKWLSLYDMSLSMLLWQVCASWWTAAWWSPTTLFP